MSGQRLRVAGAVLAALAALALVGAAAALLARSDDAAPVRIVAPEPAAVSEAEADIADIKVQVSGAVMFPGVYPVKAGDRVIDAIAAAGGLGPGADLSGVNLSRRVKDEAHYHIPAIGKSTPAAAPTAGAAGESGGLIDLNTAPAQEMESLPGIGPSLAGAIIAYREGHGPFATIDDVDNVPGIGPKTLDAIRRFVTLSAGQ